jgi:2-amino-4-hydroxy-6-hydroxymethyldihydropteridine diphosphokinase
MTVAYLALGSNRGDRAGYLEAAHRRLPEVGVTILRSSAVHETKPWGVRDQDDFLNQVLEVETALEPAALLEACKLVERDVGRTPSPRWGPREIDIDVLLYDDLQLATERLTVPHPGLGERAFVLAPLCELAPDLRPPGQAWTVAERLRALR